MNLLAYTSDQYSAFWSGVGAVATVAAAVVAIITLLSIKRDSRDRARPVLSAELLPITLSRGTMELVIQNVGSGVAKDVKVSFDPPITEDIGTFAGYVARRYAGVIPTMGPGRRLTNVYGHWTGDGGHELDEPVPQQVTVMIQYKDSHGRSYSDSYLLDVMTLRNQTTTSPGNTDEEGMRKRLVQAVEVIARGVDRNAP
jgi:hypothetical protein